jgi:putative transposase
MLDTGPALGNDPVVLRAYTTAAAGDVNQLAVIIKNRLKRIQYRPALIKAFLAQTGLTLGPQPCREGRMLAFQLL